MPNFTKKETKLLEYLVSVMDEDNEIWDSKANIGRAVDMKHTAFYTTLRILLAAGYITRVLNEEGRVGIRVTKGAEKKLTGENKEHVSEIVKRIWDYFRGEIRLAYKTDFKLLNKKRTFAINLYLKDYSEEEIKAAIDGFCKDKWEDRPKYCDITYLLRDKSFEKFLNEGKVNKKEDKPSVSEEFLEYQKKIEEEALRKAEKQVGRF